MAFPTLQTADTKNGTVTSNSTSWSLTYPTNLVSGDLIVAIAAADGNPAPTFPGGWTVFATAGGAVQAVSIIGAHKISNGTETGTFTMSLDETEQGGWRVFRVSGWYGSGLCDFTGDADGTAFASTLSGSSANPDPPSKDPANWGTEDTLWLAACAVDTSRTVSVYPTGYGTAQAADVSGGSTGATLATCWKTATASSDDPSAFTVSASDDWNSLTYAIRPAAATLAPVPTDHYRKIRHLIGR